MSLQDIIGISKELSYLSNATLSKEFPKFLETLLLCYNQKELSLPAMTVIKKLKAKIQEETVYLW